VRDLLESALAIVVRLGGERLAAAEQSGGQSAGAGTETGAAEAGAPAAEEGAALRRAARPGEIASRDDALRLLEEVARWFRRTEPHSPLSYTIEDAVRRGRMTLPELLAELMPDESSRSSFLIPLGIRPPPQE